MASHLVPHIATAESQESGYERDQRDGGYDEKGAGHV
jgi:hypothetical protein